MLDHTEGRGADVTIEAAGAPVAVAQAMRYTRDAGRVCVVGQYTDHGEVPLNPHHDLNRKHLTVRGCWGSDFSHFYRGVRVMADPARSEPWSLLKREPVSAPGVSFLTHRSGCFAFRGAEARHATESIDGLTS